MNKEMLCPFKKTITREQNPVTGRTVTYERFEVCAGERCMAYRPGPPHTGLGRAPKPEPPKYPECLRLTNKT